MKNLAYKYDDSYSAFMPSQALIVSVTVPECQSYDADAFRSHCKELSIFEKK